MKPGDMFRALLDSDKAEFEFREALAGMQVSMRQEVIILSSFLYLAH